jgi:selenocysteine-specific elongation factor
VILPDIETLEPGEETLAQLRTLSPIVPSAGDRFVIRALSPSVTLGGGVILNPKATKLRARTIHDFSELEQDDQEGIVAALVKSAGLEGCERRVLLGLSGLPAKRLDRIVEKLKNSQMVTRFDPVEDRLIHRDFVLLLKKKILERLQTFHALHPLKEGMPKQELRSTVPGGDKLFKKVIEILQGTGELVDQGNTIRSSSHEVRLKDEEKGFKEKLLNLIVRGGNSPPMVKEMLSETSGDIKQVRNLLTMLEKEQKIIRINEDLYFSMGFVRDTRRQLAEFIEREGGITPSQFHEITGSSRKYNIPLLEYFDRERFTMRVGDQRVLRGSATSGGGGRVA